MVYWTSAHELIELHNVVAAMFAESGDPLHFMGEREPGLADAAVSRPLAQFGNRDFYPTAREKIAALVHSINASHVFRDGNKRTSVAALVVLVDRNGWRLDASDNELSELLIAVASGAAPFSGRAEQAVRELTRWIRSHTEPKSSRLGVIDVRDFLEHCARVGGTWKRSGPSYVLFGQKGSVRISLSTRSLSEPVALSYLSTIGLTEAYTGVPLDEFIDGAPASEALIRRYRAALELLLAYDRSQDDAE